MKTLLVILTIPILVSCSTMYRDKHNYSGCTSSPKCEKESSKSIHTTYWYNALNIYGFGIDYFTGAMWKCNRGTALECKDSKISTICGGGKDKCIEAINNGVAFIGMPEQALYLSMGRPLKTNYTQTANGRREQLIYKHNYVYLDNGVVSAIQNRRHYSK